MNGKIETDGRVIEYVLVRKKVKNINIRVSADGVVRASAPARTTVRAVEEVIKANAEKILRAVDAAMARVPEPGSVVVYGQPREIAAVRGRRGETRFDGDGRIVVTVTDPGDAAAVSAELRSFLEKECERTLRFLVDKLMPLFAARGAAYPVISFNHAKGRWGSCSPESGRIRFSYAVVTLPPECIGLTAAHELTHLLVCNHSAAFYSELAKVVPDHRQLAAVMKNYSPASFFSSVL